MSPGSSATPPSPGSGGGGGSGGGTGGGGATSTTTSTTTTTGAGGSGTGGGDLELLDDDGALEDFGEYSTKLVRVIFYFPSHRHPMQQPILPT